MKYRLTKGMMLIEALLYAALLSFLVGGFMYFSFGIYMDNIKTNDAILQAFLR
ncbi:MAG: hypothetical protein M1459_02855 [Patescibacteria group bacterium]|nr:hypothetical protein [Patescibacteria group bacterium]